ncbi:hypothetical protein [Methylobacterium terrae]|uniref:hypothetical protein n=1 Tax=Methylobacterium terrae TaxID=2202827 RepID=UPI0013A550DC|nr:hypothetical protein [Methylobacterium terrae]
MRITKIVILGGMLALGACNSARQPEEPKVYGRVDCKRAADHPELDIEMEQAKAVCLPRAEAAAVAGTTAIPVGRGIGGAIASGIERGMAQRQIGEATTISCMAERGYLFKTRSEHLQMCEIMQQDKAAKARAVRRRSA